MRAFYTVLTFAVLLVPAWADVRLPRLLSDGAVLQRELPVRIWGTADPGEKITVKFRDQAGEAEADSLGRWELHLKPLTAGGPDVLTVTGNNMVTVKDVLVGDVWIGSGQSNMAWTVERSNDAEKEIAAANYPKIRLLKVANKVSDVPQGDVEGSWSPCSPESVRSFSAVAYFFGRDLHQKLSVPIGLIQSAWGGTPAESWTSMPALTGDPALVPMLSLWAEVLRDYPVAKERYERALKEWEAKSQGSAAPGRPQPPRGPGHPHTPAGLYNAMIAPLVPYAIKGAIWYQGESNADVSKAPYYNRLFETMIRDWRTAWGQGDFPFLFVQLANFKTGPNSRWPELREAQSDALVLRNTGMAVTVDIGNPEDIHPRNKQDVGARLAVAARALAYGEKDLEYSGPLFRQANLEGETIRVWFDHAATGLKVKGGDLKAFEIAGQDGKFVPATAKIDGNSIVVSTPDVTEPSAVRYGWADSPECNLYNAEGLPASPFRSRLVK
jgi:sialate O-acetylesterase